MSEDEQARLQVRACSSPAWATWAARPWPAWCAFASALPSVYVVGPDDPRPEQTFGYLTVAMPHGAIDAGVAAQCLQKEIEWVMVHSSSAEYIQMDNDMRLRVRVERPRHPLVAALRRMVVRRHLRQLAAA